MDIQITPGPKVLILGHSFISRLTQALTYDPKLSPDFNLAQCSVSCYGISGGTVDRLKNNDDLNAHIQQFQPSVIILQIGGNDLCDPSLKAETLACNIVDLMSDFQLHYSFVNKIVVCELFTRTQPWYITAEQYENKRRIVNQMLPILVDDKKHFWKHLRLMNSPLQIFASDGVHLSALGMQKYYRSLRLAILHAIES
ncbi:Hypothetical predicted protein [Mytilus galloprovincialis]|uniref:SGNH hydrolase-type esterase domain-containing protein n=1 Tax=Mytilus galloprovincialis TaxID=29158 RepID=A0A8B6GMZ1_MYTGA|nr:Hypothetical predicted protein [Mytilus galloprovincialis]VDI66827.1 Hypothetical predicted protein [Mytilus galloprovincialis]